MTVALFTKVLSMSATASLVILLVLVARLLIRKSPKIFSYVLWLAVLVRLLCPFSIKTTVPAMPQNFDPDALVAQWAETVAEDPDISDQDAPELSEQGQSPFPSPDPLSILSLLWLTGVAGMTLYSGISLQRLRRKLRDAVPQGENIYIADHIGAPFVMGLLRPKIYLPSHLSAPEREYILAHERHHLRRLDHVTKLLAFAALSIHWFNPLVWVAFRLFSRDMEMSCDEAVLKKLGREIRSDYSQSLLNLTAGRRAPAWTPLSFGEADTGDRIKNILKWKKPSAAVVVVTAVLTAAISLCSLTDAQGATPADALPTGTELSTPEETLAWTDSLPLTPLSGTIVRSYDPKTADKLTEGQLACLAKCLSAVTLSELSSTIQPCTEIFSISLQQADMNYVIRFGYHSGDIYVTVAGQAVDNDDLTAALYHIYAAGSPISYTAEHLPANAVFQHHEHSVYTYTYFCDTCGQWEVATVGERCSCCKLAERKGERWHMF